MPLGRLMVLVPGARHRNGCGPVMLWLAVSKALAHFVTPSLTQHQREMSPMSNTTFIAAVVQIGSLPDNPLATAEKAAAAMREASAKGAKLAVFPEALIGGYPKGASFGAPIGMRKPEGRDAFARYHSAAIDLDGPEVELLTQAAAETGLFNVDRRH